MRFQVRDLMFSVMPRAADSGQVDCPCAFDSTQGNGCDEGDEAPGCQPSCKAQSCAQGSQQSPRMGREMLGILRDQLRQALLPA